MPAAIDERIKRKVIQQWISGEPRDKIAAENNIGAGTVTSIVSNYKVGLETLDFDSIRQLALEIR
jgi:Helix-turn-helix domain